MLEKDIIRAIRTSIERRGGKIYKLHGSPYAQAGAPDLIGSLCGRPFVLEVKRPGLKATALQEHELNAWREQGWVAAVVCSADEALKAIGLQGYP